jgi:SsrA-binding protein
VKVIATNRKAKRDYQVIEKYEAGIELKGMEVKSLRTKGCSLDGSFARIEGTEIYLYNMHITEFEKASYFKVDPRRTRKLLLHKKQIRRLFGLMTQKGLTLIPLVVYFNEKGYAKVEIGLAKGRRLYDKRKKIKDEIIKKEAERALKRHYRGHKKY